MKSKNYALIGLLGALVAFGPLSIDMYLPSLPRNAKVYSGQLVRYRPDGQIDRIIEMPVKKITSAVFGGKNLDVLFVTSMSQPPLPRFPDDNQLRGSVFAIYGLGIQGLADARFMG